MTELKTLQHSEPKEKYSRRKKGKLLSSDFNPLQEIIEKAIRTRRVKMSKASRNGKRRKR